MNEWWAHIVGQHDGQQRQVPGIDGHIQRGGLYQYDTSVEICERKSNKSPAP